MKLISVMYGPDKFIATFSDGEETWEFNWEEDWPSHSSKIHTLVNMIEHRMTQYVRSFREEMIRGGYKGK